MIGPIRRRRLFRPRWMVLPGERIWRPWDGRGPAATRPGGHGTYRSIVTGGYSSRTTWKPASPSGLTAGDCVVAYHYVESLTTTMTAPSGGSWTTLVDDHDLDGNGSSDYTAYVHYIGSISASDVTNWTDDAVSQFTISTSTATHHAVVVHSGRATSPIDDSDVQTAVDFGAWPTANATAAANGADLVYCAMNYPAASTTPPSGYTERYDGGEVAIGTNDDEASGAKSVTPGGTSEANMTIFVILAAPGAASDETDWMWHDPTTRRGRPRVAPYGPQ